MSAETWFSYEPTLLKILDVLRPSRCLEFGSGHSTALISRHKYVTSLDSVDHDSKWIARAKQEADASKTLFIIESNEYLYPYVKGRYSEYDLIFIDGIMRAECLREARQSLTEQGVVILHDAQRVEYQREIYSYGYISWHDSKNTCVLAESDLARNRLMVIPRENSNSSA